MGFLRPFIVATVAVAMSGAAFAATNTMNHVNNAFSKHSMTINLGQQNNSKQDGQAFLNDTSGGLKIKVQVKHEPAGASEPTHIHDGTCKKLNPAPWKPLSPTVNGVSVTTIPGLTLAQLKDKKMHYAINLHESATNIKHYVSCGDL